MMGSKYNQLHHFETRFDQSFLKTIWTILHGDMYNERGERTLWTKQRRKHKKARFPLKNTDVRYRVSLLPIGKKF